MVVYIVIVLCFLAICIYQNRGRQRKTPAGLKDIPIEKGLPFIGVWSKIETSLCNYLFNLRHKHGPIYRIKYGMRDIVVLNTFKYIKEALVQNGNAFSGRWKSQKYLIVAGDAGMSFIDGKAWAEKRSFVLKILRQSGIGGSRSMQVVQEECMHLLEDLEKLKGNRVNLSHFLPMYTANVISKLTMNKRFTAEDPEFQILEKANIITLNQNDPISNFSLMFPFLENNEWLIRFIIWVTSRGSLLGDSHDLLSKKIDEHLDKLDFNSEGDDLVDKFLIKQRQVKEKGGSSDIFSNFAIVINVLEFISAGSGTTAAIFTWCFFLLGRYPEVQDKVYQEIIDKIGSERMPTMSDKVSLNFTQAVMDEIMRLASAAPLALFHRTLEDVSVHGYFIPKDTVVIPNLFACNLDPRTWEKPFEFHPEHFLSSTTNGELRYQPREELIPFSMGKRQCVGEPLARIELFIFFTSIVQRFHVSLENDKSDFDVFTANAGVIRTPVIESVIFKARQREEILSN